MAATRAVLPIAVSVCRVSSHPGFGMAATRAVLPIAVSVCRLSSHPGFGIFLCVCTAIDVQLHSGLVQTL